MNTVTSQASHAPYVPSVSLETASLQEIFDFVVAHLRKQNAKALLLDEEGFPLLKGEMCAYRAPDGKMCAFGCLIPDAWYTQKFENVRAFNVLLEIIKEQNLHIDGLAKRNLASLLGDLQNIHDASEVFQWEEKFAQIAQLNKLIYTAPGA